MREPRPSFFRFSTKDMLLATLVVSAYLAAYLAARAPMEMRQRSSSEYAQLLIREAADAKEEVQRFRESLSPLIGNDSSWDVRQDVLNGVVILLRIGDTFGAMTMKEQHQDPEMVVFDWWLRSNNGVFDVNDPDVSHGTGRCISSESTPAFVEFGPFSLRWSGSTLQPSRYGVLYYGRNPGAVISERDTLICFTEEMDVSTIDPGDAKWVYRGNYNEVGVPGDQSVSIRVGSKYPKD